MLHNRIAQARNYAGFNQDEFAKKLGVGKRTLADYEKGISEPKATVAADIAEICNIDAWWLLTGKGSMEADTPNQELKQCETPNSDMIDIPYFKDACVAAGCGTINHHSEAEVLRMSKTFLSSMYGVVTFTGLEALNVSGESMSPQLNDGDVIVVLKNAPVVQGGIYVVVWHGESMVKRVQRNPKTGAVKLISDNPLCDSYMVEDDDLENLNIVGQVVSHMVRTK